MNPSQRPLLSVFRTVLQGLGLLAGLLPMAALPATEPNPLSGLLSATFRLYHQESSGTCFLVAPPKEAGWPRNALILVTAAHALQDFKDEECRVVMREKGSGDTLARREVSMKVRSGDSPLWVQHPEADVAAIKLTLPDGITCQPVSLDRLARAQDFQSGAVSLGADAWVFAFPAKLEANAAGMPVLRHGVVASLPPSPLSTNFTFLVDASTFGGDSGAPLIIWDRSASSEPPLIAGVVTGMQRQTDTASMPFEERTVHHPLRLAIVVHSECVRQTIRRLLE